MAEIYLVDANIFISLLWSRDANHARAKDFFLTHTTPKTVYIVNNYILAEVVTVLSLRSKNVFTPVGWAREVYKGGGNVQLEQISEHMQKRAIDIFESGGNPRLSFQDCTLIAQAVEGKYSRVCTFDEDVRKHKALKGKMFYPA